MLVLKQDSGRFRSYFCSGNREPPFEPTFWGKYYRPNNFDRVSTTQQPVTSRRQQSKTNSMYIKSSFINDRNSDSVQFLLEETREELYLCACTSYAAFKSYLDRLQEYDLLQLSKTMKRLTLKKNVIHDCNNARLHVRSQSYIRTGCEKK